MVSQYDIKNFAQFQPLSIQEMWAPSQQLRQQHDQLSEEFAQQEQAGGLSLLGLKEGVDDAAIKIHKTYMDETKKAADELATKGFIESGRRKNLYGLKQQYNQNVVPLQNQLKIRQERSEELRRMQLQDPTFRATMNPNEIGLVDGLKNPEAFNYSGVSGNQMYKSVAEKANQLSKVIEQEHPDLIKSGLSYNYFTAVQSGASLEQVDAAMRRQYNPKDVDKMTNLMRGVVKSTFNEFGIPQKFANNQKVQDELWQTASQGLYAALGQKQFGTMHDSWGEGNARRAQALADAKAASVEPPGKTHKEYDAAFDKKNFKEIDNLVNSASFKSGTTSQKSGSGTNMYLSGHGAPSLKFDDKFVPSLNNINKAQQELFKRARALGKDLGFELPSKVANKDLPELNKRISEALKDQYRTANLSRHFFNPSEETGKKFAAAISEMTKIVDVNGDKVDKSKIFSESGKLIGDTYLVRGVNGTTLKTVDKDGNQISIPFDISKLGSIKLSNLDKDIRTLTNEQISRKYNQPGLTKDDLEDEVDRILTSEQYTETKSQNTNPGYQPYE